MSRLAGTKSDDSTPAKNRVIQGHCSRPIANPEFFKNLIDTPLGWTNAIFQSCSQQYLDKILLNGLIAGGKGRHMLLLGRASSTKRSRTCSEKLAGTDRSLQSSQVGHRWHTHTAYEIDLVKAQEIGVYIYIYTKLSVMLLFTSETFQQSVLQARSNDLVRKKIRNRTAPRMFPCIGRPIA